MPAVRHTEISDNGMKLCISQSARPSPESTPVCHLIHISGSAPGLSALHAKSPKNTNVANLGTYIFLHELGGPWNKGVQWHVCAFEFLTHLQFCSPVLCILLSLHSKHTKKIKCVFQSHYLSQIWQIWKTLERR